MIPESEKLGVLIVGTEDFTRSLLVTAAEESGLFGTVITADDAYEALAQLSDAHEAHYLPDVVIVDSDLEPLTGAQLAEELRKHPQTRHLFIAILSTTSGEEDQQAARQAGANYFGMYTSSMTHLLSNMSAIVRQVIGDIPSQLEIGTSFETG